MSAQELITELSRQGIIIEAVGDELRIAAPKGVLTSDLRQELVEHKQAILTLLSPPPIVTAPTIPEPDQREFESPPRRLYMDSEREEIIAEILRLERKHIKEGLHYDRVRYLGDNTLNRRKEFLLDYLYSLCDHLEHYTIGIHDLAEREAIREYEREVSAHLKQQKQETFSPQAGLSPQITIELRGTQDEKNVDDNVSTITNKRKHFDFLPREESDALSHFEAA